MGNSDQYSQPSSTSVLPNFDTSISEVTLNSPALRPPSKENLVREEIERRCESPRDVVIYREEIKTFISSLEVPPDENQRRTIRKIEFFPSKIIGLSGNGTVVFEGCYEDKPAAVKRIPLSHEKLAKQEVLIFLAFSPHQNVVGFFGVEHNEDFAFLAMERCDCNLQDLINQITFADSFGEYELVSNDGFHCSTTFESLSDDVGDFLPLKNKLRGVILWKKNNGRPSPVLLKLMKDMVLGLIHLHKWDLIHRDLKPENILIIMQGSTLCAKLTDMGITRQLRGGKNFLTNHFSSCGTIGWTAIEGLDHGSHGCQTREMDIFSMGCVLFYCIARGRHPFGDQHERETNIRKDEVKNMHMIEKFPEAFDLIPALLKADHMLRPKAIEVLHHPLFWDSEKRLSFLCDTSDRVSENSNPLIQAIESTAQKTLGTKWTVLGVGVLVQSWCKKVDDKIIKHMAPYVEGGYNFSSVRDLLRLIRNLLNHYGQLPKDIQILVGPLHEGVDDYFTSRFPGLLIEVYKVIRVNCKEEVYFKKYFKGNL